MVGTRNHPTDFQEPESPSSVQESPRKRSTRTSTSANGASPTKSSVTSTIEKAVASPTRSSQRLTTTTSSTRTSHNKHGWSHTPSNLTLGWLALSVPLVIWDTGYVLMRPATMPGGWLHKPIWSPYALYGQVDKAYGVEAIQDKYGWTGAQASVNAIETLFYLAYLYIIYTYGEQETQQGRGAPKKSDMGPLRALAERRTVHGRTATYAVVLLYSVATVTFWKTVLYWLIEVFSGFHYIGHNTLTNLVFVFIIPNGMWLVLPPYIIYTCGKEILEGLEIATESRRYR